MGSGGVWREGGFLPLFSAVPADSGPGRCFPGGHSSSGFMVMGLFFAFLRERPRLAWSFVVLGAVLGLAMGYGQVMRGAHFFSQPVGWVVGLVFPGGGLWPCFRLVCERVTTLC